MYHLQGRANKKYSEEETKVQSVNQVTRKFKNQFFKDRFKVITRECNYKLRLNKENIYIKMNKPDLNEQVDLHQPMNNFVSV